MTQEPISHPARLPTLSEETVSELQRLRGTDIEAFYGLVSALRANKWPLRAIATPLGVSRSIVSIWESKADPENFPEAEELPPAMPRKVKPVYTGYSISDEEQQSLYDLARTASLVRRFTGENAPSRQAARELETKLHYHKEQGASLAQLARACGVSRRAIAQRLEKE